jgi:toxin CptA
MGIVLALPLPTIGQAALVAAIVAWVAHAYWRAALHRGAAAVRELRLAPDLILVAAMADGRLVAGHVRASTYVGSWMTCVVWRPDGAWMSRTILLLPDMLQADEFRRLRVMLRYARSGDSQDVPASHA